jgi:hypothetical protein
MIRTEAQKVEQALADVNCHYPDEPGPILAREVLRLRAELSAACAENERLTITLDAINPRQT